MSGHKEGDHFFETFHAFHDNIVAQWDVLHYGATASQIGLELEEKGINGNPPIFSLEGFLQPETDVEFIGVFHVFSL